MDKNAPEHPEVVDVKNICDTVPDDKNTKDICEKIDQEKCKSQKEGPVAGKDRAK